MLSASCPKSCMPWFWSLFTCSVLHVDHKSPPEYLKYLPGLGPEAMRQCATSMATASISQGEQATSYTSVGELNELLMDNQPTS